MTFVRRAALQVEEILARFVEDQALPGSGVSAETFWAGFSDLVQTMAPITRALLIRRAEFQAQIDAWHHGWQETGQRGHIFGAVGQKGLPLRVCERAAADR